MKKLYWIFVGLLLGPVFADDGGRPVRVSAQPAAARTSLSVVDDIEYRDENANLLVLPRSIAETRMDQNEESARSGTVPTRMVTSGLPVLNTTINTPVPRTSSGELEQSRSASSGDRRQQANHSGGIGMRDGSVRAPVSVPSRVSPMANEMQNITRAATIQSVQRASQSVQQQASPQRASRVGVAVGTSASPLSVEEKRLANEWESRSIVGQQPNQARGASVRSAVPGQASFRTNHHTAVSARAATTRQANQGGRPTSGDVATRAIASRHGSANVTAAAASRAVARSAVDDGNSLTRSIMPISAGLDIEAPSASGVLSGCQEQYFDCLNQFCNVLDQNQKQCSCSSRLMEYREIEDNLQQANNELNNVANQIRYVGLSADEVRAILKETEAEQVMSSMEDRTQSRRMLEEIERIIMSPVNSNDNFSNHNGLLNFDMDFSFNGDFSLESLFGGGGGSFANMRGDELYKAARKQCQPILTRCASSRTDQNMIQGQYDIEVDRACLQYEAGLTRATAAVRNNVRSATQMLQRARLAVMQDQNEFDARGCVAALDACMKDAMVCGPNYARCVDPTKLAIDEAGNVVPGGDVVKIRNLIEGYSAINLDELLRNRECKGSGPGDKDDQTNGCLVVQYLKDKIGVKENDRIQSGFCRPVLDRCRLLTHTRDGAYQDNNTVVKSYMERVMAQIGAAQERIISEYASSCIGAVQICYNSQLSSLNLNIGGTQVSPSIVKPILMGACRNVSLSCAYAVFQDKVRVSTTENEFINDLSNMFFQSMLCPINSIWDDSPCNSECIRPSQNFTMTTNPANLSTRAYANSSCYCMVDFVVYNGQCTKSPTCPANAVYIDNKTTNLGGTNAKAIIQPYCQCNVAGVISSGGVCPTTCKNNEVWDGNKCAAPCPTNSTRSSGCSAISKNYALDGCVNTSCKCDANFVVYNGQCTKSPTCPANASTSIENIESQGAANAKAIIQPYCQCNLNGALVNSACPTPPPCPSGSSPVTDTNKCTSLSETVGANCGGPGIHGIVESTCKCDLPGPIVTIGACPSDASCETGKSWDDTAKDCKVSAVGP